jgi:membrane protein YdbS with pleckstrin-like domain
VLGILLMAAIGVAVLPPYPSTLDWLFGRLIPGLILLTGLCITLLVLKRIKWKAYAMRTHDIAYRSGLFWRKVVILPFNRVQHVEVTSGPLQRRFSLATLKFYTAGGSSVDLKIEGLRAEVAEQLRAHILESGAFATGTG